MENSFHFFPLWKRGMKGDLTALQKAKLLQRYQQEKPYKTQSSNNLSWMHVYFLNAFSVFIRVHPRPIKSFVFGFFLA
jgi:hypothetical protein